ncbi:flagellar hook-basal body complex protein FliE [Bacteriovorax sp. BSW11_IV]|uniref:flagellar hook-basal body complex protein FliE n=1 Tax=Bacteriovorax sp. BSW11_IV TaxID=1353529 RepID=UPI00038A3236|nr:flagellar hook-basal body complex protein FliE [Bacteriovorax sp. BSW11_IV]EQC45878.1 flagellar hook-basal body complex protein FliE [Bacteriovorax sp. BSW11_IV]
MAINNISSMNEILAKHSTHEWTRSSDVDITKALDFSDVEFGNIKTGDTKQSFSDMLATTIKDVNSLQQEANTAVQKLASGQTKNLHETMLAVEKAEIAFKTMNQIRMKVIDAYKEVMRMQI